MTAPTHSRTAAARTETEREAKTSRTRSGTTRSGTATRAPERSPRRDERRERTAERHAPQSRPHRSASTKAPQQAVKRGSVRRAAAGKAMLQSKVAQARLPFMVTVMSLLAIGLIATLWLAIAAVSGSYQLQTAEAEVNALQERKETLLRDVSALDATPALQRRASELGMVPAPEPAYLEVQQDGSVAVVGEPESAEAPPPPPPPEPPAPPAEEVPPGQQEQDPNARPPEGQQPAEQPPADEPPAEERPAPEQDAPERLAAPASAVDTP